MPGGHGSEKLNKNETDAIQFLVSVETENETIARAVMLIKR